MADIRIRLNRSDPATFWDAAGCTKTRNSSKNLQDWIDEQPLVGGGVTEFKSVGTGSVTSYQVDLSDYLFSEVPVVCCSIGFNGTPDANMSRLQIYVRTVTKAGFTVQIFNNSGSDLSLCVHWIAIQN